jgi:hypothetical protein
MGPASGRDLGGDGAAAAERLVVGMGGEHQGVPGTQGSGGVAGAPQQRGMQRVAGPRRPAANGAGPGQALLDLAHDDRRYAPGAGGERDGRAARHDLVDVVATGSVLVGAPSPSSTAPPAAVALGRRPGRAS